MFIRLRILQNGLLFGFLHLHRYILITAECKLPWFSFRHGFLLSIIWKSFLEVDLSL